MGFNSGASQATLDAVKVKTDLIPASPASETTVAAVKTQTDLIPASPASETTVAAVKTQTDLIPASPASEATSTAIKAKTDTLPPSGRLVFASDIAASVAVTAVAGDKTLPSVVIPAGAIPTGVTISRVLAGVAWRKQVDSSAADNSVNGAQTIQVRSDAPGTWRDSINLATGTLLTGASGTEGGQLIIGDNDIKVEVTGADTYEFQWASATVTAASLTFYDVQTFLIVEYQ